MRVLALECSTDTGSLILMDGEHVVWEHCWTGHERGRQAWIADIDAWFRQGPLTPGQGDVLAVGLGPGAFSGLRMAISLCRGLAMPAGNAVHGVSSGAALARRMAQETGASEVVVTGDARRNELWWGRFRCGPEGVELQGDWTVAPNDRVPPGCDGRGTLWVTPDWSRIGDTLKTLCPGPCRLVEERRVPQARDVALVAAAQVAAGRPSSPLSPIYLHPAVFVEPRYAAHA